MPGILPAAVKPQNCICIAPCSNKAELEAFNKQHLSYEDIDIIDVKAAGK